MFARLEGTPRVPVRGLTTALTPQAPNQLTAHLLVCRGGFEEVCSETPAVSLPRVFGAPMQPSPPHPSPRPPPPAAFQGLPPTQSPHARVTVLGNIIRSRMCAGPPLGSTCDLAAHVTAPVLNAPLSSGADCGMHRGTDSLTGHTAPTSGTL